MIGRLEQVKTLREITKLNTSSFVAVTGRRRVGKTYLVDEVYKSNICFSITGIQDGNQSTQILNFSQKLAEYSQFPIVAPPNNWQQAFILLKTYLQTLPKTQKNVIFLDELPWIATARSGFVQILAHLWNDYLSKQKHFILVVCGSSTSWISQQIINDKGGFHNRVTHQIKLKPFTLNETRTFLLSKKINLSEAAISEIYMIMGGIPFYLEQIKRGESATTTIDRLCFQSDGLLYNEYNNLYKALFKDASNHEAIVKSLAKAKSGLTRKEIIKRSKIEAGGPYTRAMEDLIVSGFIGEEKPFGKKKQGSIYRLIDEYSVFYHKFIAGNRKEGKGIWQLLSSTQAYRIWRGYAFETLCSKHIINIKKALGIQNVYTTQSSLYQTGNSSKEGFQVDLIVDRNDQTINLCECKFYEAPFVVTKAYAKQLNNRKTLFRQLTKTRKTLFTTLITLETPIENEHFRDAIDQLITLKDLMK